MPIRVGGHVVVDAGVGERLSPQRRSVSRLRLTCLYGGVFMMAGTVLLAVVHLLAVQAVSRGSGPVFEVQSGSTVVLAPAEAPARGQQPGDPLMSTTLLFLAVLGPLSAVAGYVTAGYALSSVRRITCRAQQASRQPG
ncbi:hypothetical protein [Streptomyces sp. NPDC088748]|uniref:hypothetical protein n=1 Tax=Streptomyces sp. NPDC088748 TaxID=3365887 RepID=UPI00382C4452